MSDSFEAALAAGVRCVFQPLVELETELPIGYEALARGPHGSALETPDALFAAARSAGRLTDLELASHEGAVATAAAAGLRAPAGLFLNVEPVALASPDVGRLLSVWDRALESGPVVIEVTERALTQAPAELERQVAALHERGFLVALDDIGADPRSLALMPLLEPDILKLDLRLTQQRTSDELAEVIHAVWAQAERTGARVVAEGIETEEHVETARAFGASLGQGWRFGRPEPLDRAAAVAGRPFGEAATALDVGETPVEFIEARRPLRIARKSRLIAISRRLEHQAQMLGPYGIVLATFQEAEHFQSPVRERYAGLAEEASFVGVFGREIGEEPEPGVRGQELDEDEPLYEEWDVCVIGPHFAAALVARDIETEDVADQDRHFAYTVTYERDLAVHSARLLMARMARPMPVEDGAASGD